MVEKPPFKVQRTVWLLIEMSVEHILGIRWLVVSGKMNSRVTFANKAPTSERRSSTICAVVERPDRHCGDDFVDIVMLQI